MKSFHFTGLDLLNRHTRDILRSCHDFHRSAIMYGEKTELKENALGQAPATIMDQLCERLSALHPPRG